MQRYVEEGIRELIRRKPEVEMLEVNVQVDHVHVVLSIAPKYAVSNVMGYLKGKLALRTMREFRGLRKRYWGRHLWARGYCVSTVGLDEAQIRKYVQWQEKRERQQEARQGRLFD